MKAQSSEKSGMDSRVAESRPWRTTCFHVTVLVFAFNLISAALFIGLVNRPVYDDGFNIFDVHNYAAKGFSRNTLLSQRNPPGPTSFVWMAAAVRSIGGNELRDARIGALLSWILLGTGLLLSMRFGLSANLWCGALVTLLVFPHAVEAAATVLTEGPAVFFAVIGALAWTEFVSRANSRPATLVLGIVGCLFIGLAVTCRQYYLALLPAAALTAAMQFRTMAWSPSERRTFAASALILLVMSLTPVLLLMLAWKGIASPGMESGASYNMMYKASAGLNFTRPIIASFYVGVYLVPLTFPLIAKVKRDLRSPMLVIATLGGTAAAFWGESSLQPGPLNTAVNAAARVFHSRETLYGLIVAVTIYNALALGVAIWERRTFISSSPPAAFSLIVVLFFVGEQFIVGGNIPFYDRYVLQVAPFLGVIAFMLLPHLHKTRLFAVAAMSLVSHAMVWRYLFTS